MNREEQIRGIVESRRRKQQVIEAEKRRGILIRKLNKVSPLPKVIKPGMFRMIIDDRFLDDFEELREILKFVPSIAWKSFEFNFFNFPDKEKLNIVFGLLPYTPVLCRFYMNLSASSSEASLKITKLSKWVTRISFFDKLEHLVLIKAFLTPLALKYLCIGLKMNKSLLIVELGRSELPRGGEYYLKEALLKREVILQEFIMSCGGFEENERKHQLSFYSIAEMIRNRVISKVLEFFVSFTNGEEDVKRIFTAAERTPAIRRQVLKVLCSGMFKYGLNKASYKDLISNPQATFHPR